MTPSPHGATNEPVEPVFVALADGHRRQVLAVLNERSGTATISELAQVLVSRQTARTPAAPSPNEHRSIRTSLHHVHVPMLAEVGLVDRTGDEITLVETLVGRRAASLLDAPVAESSLDEAFEVLAHRDRRAAIATLRGTGEPLAVPAVAEGVRERSHDDRPTRKLAVSLAHVHLPKLDDVNVVEYARSESQVVFDGLSLACREVLARMTGHLAGRPEHPDESANQDDQSGLAEEQLLELPLT